MNSLESTRMHRRAPDIELLYRLLILPADGAARRAVRGGVYVAVHAREVEVQRDHGDGQRDVAAEVPSGGALEQVNGLLVRERVVSRRGSGHRLGNCHWHIGLSPVRGLSPHGR